MSFIFGEVGAMKNYHRDYIVILFFEKDLYIYSICYTCALGD